MEEKDKIPSLYVSGVICKEDIIAFLKGCKWMKRSNGKHYVGVSGFLNGYPDIDGYNAFLSETQSPDEYKKPKRIMWRGHTKQIGQERKRQWDEFAKQNPEIFYSEKDR